MRSTLLAWAACSAIGAAVVALPDSGPRLVSFRRVHGPSAVDAVGAAVMLVAEAAKAINVDRRTLNELLLRGEIPSRQFGRRRVVGVRALETWVNEGDGPAARTT